LFSTKTHQIRFQYSIFESRSLLLGARPWPAGIIKTFWTVRDLAWMLGGVTEHILNVKCAVEKDIGGIARHVTSTPVIEIFEGSFLWEGVVETFEIACNPTVKRCYGFAYREDDTLRYVVIAETDEVNSPKMAVKTFIASRVKQSTG
jgi:hypothetical protein